MHLDVSIQCITKRVKRSIFKNRQKHFKNLSKKSTNISNVISIYGQWKRKEKWVVWVFFFPYDVLCGFKIHFDVSFFCICLLCSSLSAWRIQDIKVKKKRTLVFDSLTCYHELQLQVRETLCSHSSFSLFIFFQEMFNKGVKMQIWEKLPKVLCL